MKYSQWKFIVFTLFSFMSMAVFAAEVTVDMALVSDHKSIGTIVLKDTPYGLEIIPNLKGLPTGIHGFHVHQNPSCAENAEAAGAHLDPQKTDHHRGPYQNNGHLGDLPALFFNDQEMATLPVLAPRMSVKDLKNHALIIHAGGDNYADQPKLGGGGARMVCGVVK